MQMASDTSFPALLFLQISPAHSISSDPVLFPAHPRSLRILSSAILHDWKYALHPGAFSPAPESVPVTWHIRSLPSASDVLLHLEIHISRQADLYPVFSGLPLLHYHRISGSSFFQLFFLLLFSLPDTPVHIHPGVQGIKDWPDRSHTSDLLPAGLR